MYAIWTQNKYQVTFNTNGGSSVENKEVTYDLAYGNLPSTTKTGYTFSGWYLDNETFKNKIEEKRVEGTISKERFLQFIED